MELKSFYISRKDQLNHNHIVTACEFMYPDALRKFSSGNQTKHFNAWRSISTMACLEFKNGFSQKGLLKIIELFESTYRITNKGELLSCHYTNIEDLKAHCIKNNLAIISSNDFFYPNHNKMISINNNEISGIVFLVSQSK